MIGSISFVTGLFIILKVFGRAYTFVIFKRREKMSAKTWAQTLYKFDFMQNPDKFYGLQHS